MLDGIGINMVASDYSEEDEDAFKGDEKDFHEIINILDENNEIDNIH